MKKAVAGFALGLALLTGAGTAQAAAGGPVLMDGAELERVESRVYQNTTYVSLRAVVEALYPDAQVVWQDGQALAQGRSLTLAARPGEQYIQANDRALFVRNGVRLEAGCTLVPVRVLADALGAQVDWDAATGAVHITSGTAAEDAGYDADALYWLSRIISAESRGESLLGQIAVGNVILNRVASPEFPDTIYSVIFDSRWGGQFEPVRNGTVYDEPAQSSVLAAKLCLEGADAAGESLYFLAPALTGNHWTMENRTYVTTIGCHWFYR